MPAPPSGHHGRPPSGTAFLLAQVGAHAAARFADRLAELDLKPPQAGLMRAIAARPGCSQQQLATHLGLLPSRVVAFVDELEDRGLVRRQRSTTDRRQYSLDLTEEGAAMMRRLRGVAGAHEGDLCQALSVAEREQLAGLLGRIAEQQGLTPGVHPGLRAI